jgi:hypothetical protein
VVDRNVSQGTTDSLADTNGRIEPKAAVNCPEWALLPTCRVRRRAHHYMLCSWLLMVYD